MSHKQGQESHTNYMDGIKVKISEQYKPPPRINVAISYSQRLTLNKHIQDNIPNYDFALEASVKNKMKEWRIARNMMAEERRIRFEKSREERRIREEEKLKKEQELRNKLEQEQESKKIDNITSVHENSFTHLVSRTESPQNYITYTASSAMLIPTQVVATPYSNILTPTPSPQITNRQSQTTKTSPFNISDFEADTSSPFDNMELKTINDLEELALVLKNDDSSHKNQSAYPAYGVPQTQFYRSYQDPNPMSTMPSAYSYGNPQMPSGTKASYIQPTYSGTNGYYCPTDNLFNNQQPYTVPYVYNKNIDINQSFDRLSPQSTSAQGSDNKTLFKPVPDIIKSLETELNNTHIDKMKRNFHANKNCSVSKPTYSDKIPNTASQALSNTKPDDLEDPFNTLSIEMQQLSRTINLMGFPLPRVARACKLIGNDHKKIVEYLLAMTELLDLGFSEAQVSSALLQCNNDRDKALDVLIL